MVIEMQSLHSRSFIIVIIQLNLFHYHPDCTKDEAVVTDKAGFDIEPVQVDPDVESLYQSIF